MLAVRWTLNPESGGSIPLLFSMPSSSILVLGYRSLKPENGVRFPVRVLTKRSPLIGLGALAFNQKNAGSNPVYATKIFFSY